MMTVEPRGPNDQPVGTSGAAGSMMLQGSATHSAPGLIDVAIGLFVSKRAGKRDEIAASTGPFGLLGQGKRAQSAFWAGFGDHTGLWTGRPATQLGVLKNEPNHLASGLLGKTGSAIGSHGVPLISSSGPTPR